MQLSREKFDEIIADMAMFPKATTKALAEQHKISERMIQRVKEAGTWQRWPYIVAKATHGFNTPEYKKYLKRRGLPLTPPAKADGAYTQAPRERETVAVGQAMGAELKKRSLFGRLFRRGE